MKYLYQYLTVLLLVSSQVFAEQQTFFADELLDIQQRWARINYSLQGDEQQDAFKQLVKQTEQFSLNYPQRAEPWIWKGIIQSSYAGAKGGLGALSLVKEAKKSLERAIKIDESALSGSAYTSLGTLYHQVPGWPIGFGNDKQAKKLLEKACLINPQGIDSNYFYGSFLYDEGDYQQAKKRLLVAQHAPKRSNRPLADKERQKEVAQLLAKVEQKIR
jgi:tetratricopeptide (TPR) repeat protein